MENLSKHITYKESVHSDTAKRLGILNKPDENQLKYMKDLATRIFEPLREHFGVPIYISSFFRSRALNKALKGATSSQHMYGQAMDIDADTFGQITNKQIFDYIKDNLPFDQLILENVSSDGTGGWVHVSLNGYDNRREILIMEIVNNKQIYKKYDT